jgi:hypothetical protein
MDAVTHLAPTVGVLTACDVLGVARASFYRQRPLLGPPASPAPELAVPAERTAPSRSLSAVERASVLAVLHEERFQDRSPAAVQATLLDEGQYLCSSRTMYRILQQEGESRERRDQASLTAPMIILTRMILAPRFCFSHRDHSLLREAVSSSTCRQAKVVVTSPIA